MQAQQLLVLAQVELVVQADTQATVVTVVPQTQQAQQAQDLEVVAVAVAMQATWAAVAVA
jgi:hypothetical protein